MTTPNTIILPRRRSLSLVQEVMNDLCAKIQRGLYQPGEKLPTEPEVMAEQGVSRTVVREAMSRLQAAGLVETRHGVGTFVLTPSATPAEAVAINLTVSDVLAMLELRVSVETEAAGLAALRRSEEQLTLMRRALDDFDEKAGRGESTVDADFRFHLQIALVTGNKYFEDFYRRLGVSTIPRTRLDLSKFMPEPTETYMVRLNFEHRSILDAIAQKDPQTASAGMRMHLSSSYKRLRQAIELADQHDGVA